MRAYWNDGDREVTSDMAEEVSLGEASLIWSDEVRGIQGNFFGLIDDQGRTLQFYFDASIPDDVDDARHLQIVLMDFPLPEKRGSYAKHIAIGEVDGMIETAFRAGLDFRHFGELAFSPW